MAQEPGKPRGVWQFAVFALALVLATLVWLVFPEPEESRRGYTPRGCYESGRMYFRDAERLKGPAHDYPRSERYLTAVRYFEALERRFGIGRARRDAYEMLADAKHELALAGEAKPLLRRRFRLESPETLREQALRAYREALARMDEDTPQRSMVLRKQAEVLVELGKPGRPAELDEGLGILRGLVKLYRQSKVDGLRLERGEVVDAARGGARVRWENAAELAEEARTVYLLAGRAAAAASELHLAAARAAPVGRIRAEEELLAAARSDEAARAFRLFTEAGGAGERRVKAEKALGDLAFRRAQKTEGADSRRALEEARTHYGAAGTRQTAFLLARVLFGLGEYDDAKRRFAHTEGASPAESRARAYMRARCDLALGRFEEARAAFADIEKRDPGTAEAASALVSLARIALEEGRLDEAARFLSGAVVSGVRAARGVELPERDSELRPARLAGMLRSVAEEFDDHGEFDRAIELYGEAAGRDPDGPARCLKLAARAWEKRAAAAEHPGQRRESFENAAGTYVKLAGFLPAGPARREAERLAAERFAGAGLYSRAIEVARGYVVRHPGDRFTSRVLHELGTWEASLGLSAEAEKHFRENVERHPTDVYADRSRVELAKLLIARGSDDDLREAALVLGKILGDERRYGKRSLVRLEALFVLGRVDLRLAERLALAGEEPAEAERLFKEAADRLEEALAFRDADFPAMGPNARPLFRGLIEREGPAALEAFTLAHARLTRREVEPLTGGELDRRWNEISGGIGSFQVKFAGTRDPGGARED